jgi:pyruvate dehydrogenase E2 component (dihydrolipoamide acetyltransferase)
MAEIVRMPKLSDTMAEGVVAKWHKKIGDEVASGDLLADIETDKATMEFESFQDGVLLHIGVKEGETAPVDSILAIFGEKGEDISKLLEENKTTETAVEEKPKEEEPADKKPAEEKVEPKKDEVETKPEVEEENKEEENEDGRLKASPLAKKIAEDKGIKLSEIKGSGDNGRIVKRDIENFKSNNEGKVSESSSKNNLQIDNTYEDFPVSQMRKTIAKRLSESKFTAPHFYLTVEINMNKAIEARKKLNEFVGSKISFNDLIIKASALALRQHPNVNASWLGDKIRKYNYVNIGVAIAVEDGLLVPVVRNADYKTMTNISAEVKEFAEKAKTKKLQPKDWEGNTFTISNLGMFGIDEFTAIINTPDACILAVGGIKKTPIFDQENNVIEGNLMKVTLSCDHRVVDGATGSAFLNTLKNFLEEPFLMFSII